ncbi:siderophore-interacting protein, partial [Rathayibacter sp. AY2B1]|uniref:siderophore-interacting protein n=1 Tax=Rathayibacter sp. AY2B1 TaxID=2080568 RepID=UPI0021572C2C
MDLETPSARSTRSASSPAVAPLARRPPRPRPRRAVPAIAAILESLDDDATGAAFLEVPTAHDRLPL